MLIYEVGSHPQPFRLPSRNNTILYSTNNIIFILPVLLGDLKGKEAGGVFLKERNTYPAALPSRSYPLIPNTLKTAVETAEKFLQLLQKRDVMGFVIIQNQCYLLLQKRCRVFYATTVSCH